MKRALMLLFVAATLTAVNVILYLIAAGVNGVLGHETSTVGMVIALSVFWAMALVSHVDVVVIGGDDEH